MKRLVALCALTVAAGLPAVGAQAGPCDNHELVIFSRTATGIQVADTDVATDRLNPNAALCFWEQGTEQNYYDPRLILPGSNQISIRYVDDFNGVNQLTAVITGLGYTNKSVTLRRYDTDSLVNIGSRSRLYDSAWYAIDSTKLGKVTATVTLPNGSKRSVTFHTLGA